MSTNLQNSPCYPFNLDGPLCPLLNNAELLAEFYAEEKLRHGIKQFCKKTNWPGKPAVAFVIDPRKLQELMLNLFNTPSARAILKKQSDADRATYLDNAIWQWVSVTNPKLAERVSACCDDIKDRLFLKVDAFQKLLAVIQTEKPNAEVIDALAFAVLAFAMLQPDDRYRLGEAFLGVFPDYAEKLGGV